MLVLRLLQSNPIFLIDIDLLFLIFFLFFYNLENSGAVVFAFVEDNFYKRDSADS